MRDEEHVREIIETFLTAWGLPSPRNPRDTGRSMFADRLAESGRYADSNSDHHILVRRGRQPTPHEQNLARLQTQQVP